MDKTEIEILRSNLLQIAKGLELARSGILGIVAQLDKKQSPFYKSDVKGENNGYKDSIASHLEA